MLKPRRGEPTTGFCFRFTSVSKGQTVGWVSEASPINHAVAITDQASGKAKRLALEPRPLIGAHPRLVIITSPSVATPHQFDQPQGSKSAKDSRRKPTESKNRLSIDSLRDNLRGLRAFVVQHFHTTPRIHGNGRALLPRQQAFTTETWI